MNAEKFMSRYPRITAHIVAESLGYATPTLAAIIGLDGKNNRENHCEWVACCYGKNALEVLRKAISSRHYHDGYMRSFKTALALVRQAITTRREPMLASWF